MNQAKSGLIRPHAGKLSFLYRLLDITLIVCSLYVIAMIYGVQWSEVYSLASMTVVALMLFFSSRNELYRSWRVTGVYRELWALYTTWAKVLLGLLVFAFIFKLTSQYSRVTIGLWALVAPTLMTVSRLFVRNLARELRERGYNTRTVAIAGANKHGLEIKRNIQQASWMGLNFIGFFDDRGASRIDAEASAAYAGNSEELVRRARNAEIDTIYITMPLKAEERTKDMIRSLSDTTVSLYYAPDFETFDMLYGSWQELGNMPVVSIFENPYDGIDGWLKRSEDVVLASFVLLFSAIPMLIIAALIKLTSPGPVLFKQQRYGMNGEEIEVWKFRSMRVDDAHANVIQAKREDARVTRLGRFLRRTSLDELPQFINVLQGRMSIVGPRPHAVSHNEEYRSQINRYMLRHKVKPGITGWAQINGWRGETNTLDKMEKRIQYDLEYIRNWSLMFDLKIFLLTLVRGFRHRNAY
ncbi:MAG: undecaprenyl-phosphate glucose phosphotransferase [Gammaproteobacteria bacterium]|nr:undecaprenyl-phosphate glucose phosphotransferase [Gammaproteobacteria bacterium]MDH5729941.1 undecaprenyl-phosphate glucose phosphotransferase [Gammaproteobacteria bacterium]